MSTKDERSDRQAAFISQILADHHVIRAVVKIRYTACRVVQPRYRIDVSGASS